MSRKVNEEITLSGPQEQALTCLLAGKSQVATAMEVGVAPETVNRWLHGDAMFAAAFNTARADLWRAHVQHLRTLIGAAVETLETLLGSDHEGTRLRAATAILKTVALQVSPPTGPTTPEEVKHQWESEQVWADLMRLV